MRLHQYIIHDSATGEHHLVTGTNFRRGRSALKDKLLELHQDSLDDNYEGAIHEKLGEIIEDDRFHESPLSTIQKWVFDLDIMSRETTIDDTHSVCLCGSTRFSDAYQKANLDETLKGNIVYTIGCDMRSDADLFNNMSEQELSDVKERLDELHLRKIDRADEVLVLNVGGYIGLSTRREVEYARNHGIPIRWLEPDNIPEL